MSVAPVTRRELASNSLAMFLSLASSAALTALTTLIVIRVLDRPEYGVFALGLGIYQIAILVADFGISSSSARELARVRDRPEAMPDVAAAALVVKLVVSAVATVVLLLLAPVLADLYGQPELADVLRLAAAALGLTSVFQLFRLGLNALGAGWSVFATVVTESVVETIATVGLVLAFSTAASAAAGRAVGFAAGCTLGAWLFLRRVRPLGRPTRPLMRAILQAGTFIWLAEVTFALFMQVDVLIIGAVLTPSDVAAFEAPTRLLVFAGYTGYSVGLATMPLLASGRGAEGNARRFTLSLRYVAALQAGLVVGWLALVAPNATTIFGAEYADSAQVMYLLTPYFLLAGIAPLLSLATIYAGGERRRIPPLLLALVINAGITAALLDPVGIAGAAIGLDVGGAIYVLLFLGLSASLLGLALGPLVRTIALPSAIGLAAGGAGWALGTVDPSHGIASTALALIVFGALLRATGAVSREEIATLRRWLRQGVARFA